MRDFSVHMVFSSSGADACAAYLRADDRVAFMFEIDPAAFARWRDGAARICVVHALATSAPAAAGATEAAGATAADNTIDYSALVHWCADSARVVSWR